MTYTVIFSPSARCDVPKVPPRIIPAVVEFVYRDLAKIPQRVGKPLERELTRFHSARRGPYRIIYSINDKTITVELLRISHRADVNRIR